MSMPEWTAEVALAAGAQLGEGPIWCAERGELLWLDIPAQLLHYFNPETGCDRELRLPSLVTAIGLRGGGGFVCATRDGVALLDDGRIVVVGAIEQDRPDRRMNDGAVDPAGRFFAGTMTEDMEAAESALYRFDERGLTVVINGVIESNGLDWSPDGRRMYYVDTATRRLDVFAYDAETGTVSGRQALARFPESYGWPDGLTVDAEGCVWLCFWDGSAVRRLSPEGEEIGIIRLPVSRPTSCAFGDFELSSLYITSAGLELDNEPGAGNIFVARPGVQGRLPNIFKDA